MIVCLAEERNKIFRFTFRAERYKKSLGSGRGLHYSWIIVVHTLLISFPNTPLISLFFRGALKLAVSLLNKFSSSGHKAKTSFGLNHRITSQQAIKTAMTSKASWRKLEVFNSHIRIARNFKFRYFNIYINNNIGSERAVSEQHFLMLVLREIYDYDKSLMPFFLAHTTKLLFFAFAPRKRNAKRRKTCTITYWL